MADDDNAETEDLPRMATMDMGEHLRTWRLFVSMAKWHVAGLAILLLFLLMFRTHG